MAYTIITDTCEGFGDCVDACPVACIHLGQGKNAKGIQDWNWIDFAACIDCGICLQVCPIAERKNDRFTKTPLEISFASSFWNRL